MLFRCYSYSFKLYFIIPNSFLYAMLHLFRYFCIVCMSDYLYSSKPFIVFTRIRAGESPSYVGLSTTMHLNCEDAFRNAMFPPQSCWRAFNWQAVLEYVSHLGFVDTETSFSGYSLLWFTTIIVKDGTFFCHLAKTV